jgi:hypothetical protein
MQIESHVQNLIRVAIYGVESPAAKDRRSNRPLDPRRAVEGGTCGGEEPSGSRELMRGGLNGREVGGRVGWDATIRRVDAHVGGVAWPRGRGRQARAGVEGSVSPRT